MLPAALLRHNKPCHWTDRADFCAFFTPAPQAAGIVMFICAA